jgi:hypothetical protein
MKYWLITLLMLSGHLISVAQSRIYDIRFANKSIGSLTVFEPEQAQGRTIFKIEAVYSIPFSKGQFTIINHYKKDQLVYSSYQQTTNNNLKESIITQWLSQQYVSTDSLNIKKINDKISKPIEHSVCSFYYKEPKGMKAIFSERYGVYCDVSNPADGAYEMKLPDGRVSTYIFRNGLCQEVRSSVMGGNLVFILQ